MSNESGGVQSVDRAITALEILARTGEAGVGEVALAIGVHKSTASRLLGALESRGLVEHTGDRGRYRLGYGILRLAGSIPGHLDVTREGRAICEELAETVGETVNLAVLQGLHVVNIHQVHGRSAITVNNWVGRPTPLHATSSGKILLALMPEPARLDLLSTELEAFTDHTLTDPVVLARELDEAARRGFAITAAEYELGLNALAVPIRGFGGAVIAALSVSGPAYRLDDSALHALVEPTIAAGERISERMGHLG